MYFRYGSYRHEEGEVAVRMTRRPTFSETGEISTMVVQLELTGEIQGTDQYDITRKLRRLETAYSVNGYDAGLYHDNGAPTMYELRSAGAIGGVRVVMPPEYEAAPGSYVTFQGYKIALEAEFRWGGTGGGGQERLMSWQEQLSAVGNGGPRFVYVECLTGPPQRQQVAQRTVIRATQAGSAVGLDAYPSPPPPLWPDRVLHDQTQISYTAPKRTGSGSQMRYTEYGVSWRYEYLSDVPLNGRPNRWPS